MSTFESRQAAWDYYLNLDNHHSEEKQHNNIYTDAFEAGAEWANEHPDTEDLEVIMAYTFKGLGWLAENVEFDMGTMGERVLACTETLQMICNQAIMELRKPKKIKL